MIFGETETFSGKLRRNVIIHVGLAVLLLSIVVSMSLVVSEYHKDLRGFSKEARYLDVLSNKVDEVEKDVLRLFVYEDEVVRKAFDTGEMLNILAESEDFSVAFDFYRDAITRRGSLTEASLLSEFEPMLNILRYEIVKIVSLCKQNKYDEAKIKYHKFMRIRFLSVKQYVNDSRYLFEKSIAARERWLAKIEFYVGAMVILLIVGMICYIFRFNRLLLDTVAYPMEIFAHAMSMVAMGEYSYRLILNSHDEFNELGDVFNCMFDVVEASTNELTRAKEEAEKLQGQLIESSKMAMLGEMSSGIAHELSQPLGAILLKSQLLPKLIDTGDSERAVRISSEIRDQTVRAKKIMDSLRVISREDRHDEREECEFNDILSSVLVLFEDDFRLKKIGLDVVFSDDDTSVMVSRVQIGQVLTNLLSNAKDAVDENDEKEIKIKTYLEDEYVIFEIVDNGCGIKSEIAGKIFEPFFTTKPVGKGTGLGLSMSYSMVHENDGNIVVKSVVGEGTEFKLIFPFRKAA